MIMKDKFLKDLPIYINGFAVGTLFFRIPNVGIYECAMFVLSSLTFFWYGRNCVRESNENKTTNEI